MNDDASIPPSPPNDNVGPNSVAHVGGNEGVPFPPAGDPFWNAPAHVQVEWQLDRQAEHRFNQRLDAYLKQANRGYTAEVPALIRKAVQGLAWSMMQSQKGAYESLRDGNTEVPEHFIHEAYMHIKGMVEDFQNYKRGRPL